MNVGLPSESMRIMAIADLNNDKFNDLVTINNEGTEFSVHYFEENTLTYTNSVTLDIQNDLYIDSVFVMKSPQAFQSLLIVASEK